MISEKETFIVKEKNIDVEIKQSIFNNYKSIKTLIYVEIFAFVFILIKILFSKKIETGIVMYFGLFLILTAVIILEYNWSIKIKEKIIYIKNYSGNHIIEFKDLISLKKCVIDKHKKSIEIKYLKNNKIKRIFLPYENRLESQIEQICSAFITTKDLDEVSDIGTDCFNKRDDDECFIEKKVDINRNKIAIYIIILLFIIISCITSLIGLYKIIK